MKLIAFALAASGCLLTGQVTGVSHASPRLGFVPGATPGILQPILGLPGAARLGDPIALPNAVVQLQLAPGHAYAVAMQPSDGATVLLRMRGRLPMAPITGALAHPDLVSFSPSGRALVLYSQSSNRLQVFTGLPDTPGLARDIATVSMAGGVSKAAISDDAQILLIADETGTVYRISQAAAVPLYHTAQVAWLAFVPGAHDAIVSDPTSNSVVILDAATGRADMLPSPANRCQPDEVAATADSRTVLVACPAQHLVWSVNRDTGMMNVIKIPVSPLQINRVAARDTFLLSPPDQHGSYWIVSIHPDALALSFVGAHVPGAGE